MRPLAEFDSAGYLTNPEAWSRELSASLAEQDQLALTPDHWTLIDIARDFHAQYRRSPSIRVLVNLLKDTRPDLASSLVLQALFPKGTARQLSKIAGLPKPLHCT